MQKTEIKNVRHNYTHEELEQLGGDLARAFSALRGVETEFDQVKASYKSKTAEAEAKIDRLSTNRMNGFEMREWPCFVVFRPKDKEKDYYTTEAAANKPSKETPPALTEKMTNDDFQQELVQAESKFDTREEIQLFKPAEGDRGLLVVGRLGAYFGGTIS